MAGEATILIKARNDAGQVRSLSQELRRLSTDVESAQRRYTAAIDRSAAAQRRLNNVQASGSREQVQRAQQAVAAAEREVRAAEQNLSRREQALNRTRDAEARAVRQTADLTRAQEQAAAASARRAREEAQVAEAIARTARAEQQARTEAIRTAEAQERLAAAALRRQQAEERARRASQDGGDGEAPGGVRGRLNAGLVNAAAGLSIAGEVIGVAQELASVGTQVVQTGQQVRQVDAAFTELAQSAGTTREALLEALRAASGGEISDFNLQLATSKAALLGVGDSAEELGPLLEIARDRARRLGLDTTQAFADLVEGLGKAEPEILDNLGITVNLTQVYDAYASQLGVTAAELTTAQKSQALLNAVLEQAGDMPPPTDEYAALGATLQTIADTGSRAAAEGLEPLTRGVNRLGQAILGNREAFSELQALFRAGIQGRQATTEDVAAIQLENARRDVDAAGAGRGGEIALRAVGADAGAFDATRERLARLNEEAARLSLVGPELRAQVEAAARAFGETGDIERYSTQIRNLTLLQQQQAAGVPPFIALRQQQAQAEQEAAAAARQQELEQQRQIATSVQARAEAELLAARQRELDEAARAAAAGSASIEDAAARLAGQFPIARDEAEKLITALRELRALESGTGTAAPSLRQQEDQFRVNPFDREALAGERANRYVRDLQRSADEAQRLRQQAAGAEAARLRQLEATGATSQIVALREQQLAEARARFGAGSEQAIDAETQLIRAQRALDAEQQRGIRTTNQAATAANRLADAKERQARATIDARLAALDDSRQRREEARELETARRVLTSAGASSEQRQAAREVLERIPLEQARRQLDIAAKARDADGQIVDDRLVGAAPGATPPAPATAPPIASVPGAAGDAVASGLPAIDVQVLIDGEPILARVIARLRGGLGGAISAGSAGRR